MPQDELFPDLDLQHKKDKAQRSGLLDFPATYDATPAQVTQPTGPILETLPHDMREYTGIYTTRYEIAARRALFGLLQRDYIPQFIEKDGYYTVVIPGVLSADLSAHLHVLADVMAHADTIPPALQTFKRWAA